MMPESRLIGTYLNDHFAGSVAGLELARRAAANNRSTAYGPALAQIAEEIAEDQATLERTMKHLQVGPDRSKVLFAWGAEKVGRLKLNGRLIGYSPLSRLEEIELLSLGIEAKLLLWQALAEMAEPDFGAIGIDLTALVKRARSQRRRLERYRLRAAAEALR